MHPYYSCTLPVLEVFLFAMSRSVHGPPQEAQTAMFYYNMSERETYISQLHESGGVTDFSPLILNVIVTLNIRFCWLFDYFC